MLVHDGQLYVGTWSYDWTRVRKDSLDFCHVYRYRGGQEWEDCGQPSQCRRLFGLASYKGRIYVLGDDYKCHAYEGGTIWKECGRFRSLLHPMTVHDGKLYVAEFQDKKAIVWSYDGTEWNNLGCPLGGAEPASQIHALETYHGKLHATTWPTGKVAVYEEGKWVDCGRLGDSFEINALTVYNGKLYAGSIPRAEVFRYEGGALWTQLKRFFAPKGWEPVPVDTTFAGWRPPAGVTPKNTFTQWTRVTALTVYDGKLFAGIGSCTSAFLDAPPDVRGRVFAMQAGECISYDRDLGPGWKHLAAIRKGNRLQLHINGKLELVSSGFDSKAYSISNAQPLKIGYGEMDYFSGRLREVRLYNRALAAEEIKTLSTPIDP